jgi:hypothetical protein
VMVMIPMLRRERNAERVETPTNSDIALDGSIASGG